MKKMATKRAIAFSAAALSLWLFVGIALYGFFIPGSILDLAGVGGHAKTVYGNDIFRGNENGPQYTVDGDLFTSMGGSPYFVIDVSGMPQFRFVRIDISNLEGFANCRITWTDSSSGFSGPTYTDSQRLDNGINVFQFPRDADIRALKITLTDAHDTRFNLNSITFTNNWYVPPAALAGIFALALMAAFILFDALAINAEAPCEDMRPDMETLERNIFGFLCVLLSAIALSYAAVMTIIKANPYLDIERIEALYSRPPSEFVPEPHEFQRFALYCILICAIGLAATLLYRKYMNRIPYQTVKIINAVLFVVLALSFFLVLQAVAGAENSLLYTDISFYSHPLLTAVLFALGALAYRAMTKRCPRLRVGVLLCDAAVAGTALYFSLLHCDYNLTDLGHADHFSVIFHPIYELSQGRALGADFEPQYGLHGYFFYYLQRAVWGNIHYKDTITLMGWLVFVGNIALYVFLVKMFRGRLSAALTLMAIMFFNQVLALKTFGGNPYYAYWPIRTIAPVLTLCLISFIHTARDLKSKTVFLVLAALAAAAGVFWNTETGVVAIMTLAGYMVYCALAENKLTEPAFWKKAGFSFAIIAACFAGCYLLLLFITAMIGGGGVFPVRFVLEHHRLCGRRVFAEALA
jgi:hypothetical protein